MTHTEISDAAGQRLEELATMPIEDAVIDCINAHSKELSNDYKSIMGWLVKSEKTNNKLYYFAESTTSSAVDPLEKVDAQLRNGFTTGGTKFDLNSVPIWKNYESETRNIRYKAHSWLMLDSLLVADEITDDDYYLQKAVVIADDWIQHFIIGDFEDEFSWYDMAIGQRATKLPYMLRRLIQIDAPYEQIFRFIIASEIHMTELLQEERIATHSNHGLFQLAGLIALAKTLPWMKDSEIAFNSAENILTKMLDEHFGKDGLHLEHSPDYHLYMMNHLNSFVKSKWLTNSDSLMSIIENVERATHWMCAPDSTVIPIGDTANNVKVSKRWGGGSNTPNIGLKAFIDGGLIIENTSSKKGISQLVFSAQFHSRQHKHADDLNVLYYLNGKPLLVDPGTYTYQYDLPERIYCESTRSHNTVEIDELNFSRFRQDAFGSGLSFCTSMGPCTILRGSVHHSRLISSFIPNNKIHTRDGVKVDILHSRTIIHYPNRFLAIIDQIDSPKTHDYMQWNHFSPDLQVRKITDEKYSIQNSKEEIISIVSNSSHDNLPLHSKIIRGQTQPHLQGWMSPQGNDLIENTALGFSTVGANTIFVTVFDFKMKNTGSPYIRSGSGGKYQRFALTQEGSKIDIKFREAADGEITIDALIDGDEFSEVVSK